jgi:hypothetical protein
MDPNKYYYYHHHYYFRSSPNTNAAPSRASRNCYVSDRNALQRVVKMAQYINRTALPPIQDILRKPRSIIKEPTPPRPRAVHSLTVRQTVSEDED